MGPFYSKHHKRETKRGLGMQFSGIMLPCLEYARFWVPVLWEWGGSPQDGRKWLQLRHLYLECWRTLTVGWQSHPSCPPTRKTVFGKQGTLGFIPHITHTLKKITKYMNTDWLIYLKCQGKIISIFMARRISKPYLASRNAEWGDAFGKADSPMMQCRYIHRGRGLSLHDGSSESAKGLQLKHTPSLNRWAERALAKHYYCARQRKEKPFPAAVCVTPPVSSVKEARHRRACVMCLRHVHAVSR